MVITRHVLLVATIAGVMVTGCTGSTGTAETAATAGMPQQSATLPSTAARAPSAAPSLRAPSFTTGQVITAPPSAFGGDVAIADANGDGKPDLALCVDAKPVVALFVGNGEGTFKAPLSIDAGRPCIFLVAADLSGDGTLDLAASGQDGSASVMLGAGRGTFAKPTVIPAVGDLGESQGWGLASGDLNGDGAPDLLMSVFAWHGDFQAPGHVAVLLNKGSGKFSQPVFYADRASVAIAAADFDGDGKLDVATADGDASVRVFRGDGTGRLGSTAEYPIGGPGVAILTGDFNGDGHLDVATGDDAASKVGVMMGKGDGTFVAARELPAGNTHTIAIADLDGDGHLDLVAGGYSEAFVRILTGLGDGTFAAESRIDAGGAVAQSVGVTDLNRDGRPDVVVADGASSVHVFLGRGD
jgi:FG-GAP-like repeat